VTATLAGNLSELALLQAASTATGTTTGAVMTAITCAGVASGSAVLSGALLTQAQCQGLAVGVASLVGALTTVSAADLGATLPTHIERIPAIRTTALASRRPVLVGT
jgi:hypothetical protein